MNKPVFTKLNRKGKIILGFMAVAITSPLVLAACGNSQNSSNNAQNIDNSQNNNNFETSNNDAPLDSSSIGEMQALSAVSKLLGYKRGDEDAVFQNIPEMENFYYTGNVKVPKSDNTEKSAAKASIFSSVVYYYVVPGKPDDNNSKLFFEGEAKVMQKLYDITNGKFQNIQVWSFGGDPKDLVFDNFAPHGHIYVDDAEYFFNIYQIIHLLSKLKILLAPNNQVAQALIKAYQQYAWYNKDPIVSGQNL